MAARKRTARKPKASTLHNDPSSMTRRKSREAIGHGDFTLYLRLSLLVTLILGVGGFLLYPDILSIVKSFQDDGFSKNVKVSDDENKQENNIITSADEDLKREVKEYLLMNSSFDGSEDDEDFAHLLTDVEEGDLMENEELDKKRKNLKQLQTLTPKHEKKTETDTKDTTDIKTDKVKSRKTETANEQLKQESFSDTTNPEGTVKPRFDKADKKSGPIILNSNNKEVLLDPSQIKIVNSPSHGKSTSKQDKEVSAGASKRSTKKQDSNKSSTGTKANKPSTGTEGGQVSSIENLDDAVDEAKKFNSTFQKTFTPKKIFADGRRIPPVELLHQKESNSSVKVVLFNEFLSEQECDGLIKAHDSHVKALDKPPILCFDGIATLRRHIKDAKKNIKVTPNDFTKGTKCVNSSFSLQLQSWMKSNWSYSTAFYPGESTFSKVIAFRIKEAMGLDPASGGKFQITSYPEGKAYKEHTDCTLGGTDQRDRVVSVLMYLSDVEEGGETTFPELGIWVRPKKGRALVWNNMSPDGVCEEHSKHIASVVKKGSKYILIRWYYYKTFYSLGRRPPPPHLPERDPGQPMVNCDEYNSGSCRWYDEWSYEPLLDYEKKRFTLI